ncbi:hypothetical protein [Actinomadura sp. DC4]|uniref:hypothetical protein n=1 Tax=Actinomadura sp. DC4 TaxID=3055069 RepID=UPI0025B05106|nr:hypothetical protein [Actinomadura sp. DC4]MDN3359285.1 hypothetical protein [Actinomadura sp. DC4]
MTGNPLLQDRPGAVVSAFLDGWGDRGADEMVRTVTDAYVRDRETESAVSTVAVPDGVHVIWTGR